jgi:hypothetical protein
LKLIFDNSVMQEAKAGLRSAFRRDATSDATMQIVVVSSLSRVERRPQTHQLAHKPVAQASG